ncbi:unnamed protein product [Ostreobium quekettii]|uniref:S-acyltransferase n=1 Tax=Ostreobium quekettii TaxID=121088 RepID=A0A8S1ISW6_9CHLO|nr:unnamed protein product [Ostreobium quekettii]
MAKKVGNLWVLWNGKIFIGPDWKSLMGTFFLILIPSILFLSLIAHDVGKGILGLSLLLVAFVLAMLGFTAFSNPGIIPRQSAPVDANGDPRFLPFPRTKDFLINGYRVTTKYCATCNIYRLPRCSHCAMCNNCVEKFDHYCPWVGTCIGRRNYRYFLSFVLSATLLCIYVFSTSLSRLVQLSEKHHHSFNKAMSKEPTAIALIVYTFIAAWFVGGLSVFHMYLVVTNQTTYEHFRRKFGRSGNPYYKSLARNIFEALFQVSPPYGWDGDGAQPQTGAAPQPGSLELPVSFLTDATLASVEKQNNPPQRPPSSSRAPSSRTSSQTGPCGFMQTGMLSPCPHTAREGPADVSSIDYQDSIYTTASSIVEEQVQSRLPAMTSQSMQSMPSSFLMEAEPAGGCGQHPDGSPTVKGASSSTAPQPASDVAEDLSSHNEQGNEDGASSVSGVTAPSSQAALTAGSGDFSQFGEAAASPTVPGDPGLPHRGLAAKGETKLKQLAHLLPHSLSRTQYDELKEGPSPPEAGPQRQASKAPSWSEPHHGSGSAPGSPNPMRGIEGMMGGLGRKRYSELVDVQGPQVSAASDTKSTDSAPSASRSSTDTAPSSLFSPGKLLRTFGRSNSAQAARHLEEGGHHRSRGESDSSASGVVDEIPEDMLAESAPQNDKGVMEVVSRSLFRKGGRHSRHSSIDPLADKL